VNLCELNIVSFAYSPDIWASSSSASFTTPPTWPHLQRLSLRSLWIAPDAVRPLLRANPSIKHIDMSHCREIVLLALTLFIVKSPSSNKFVDASNTIVPVLEKLLIELSTGHTDNGCLGKLLLGVMTRRPNSRVICPNCWLLLLKLTRLFRSSPCLFSRGILAAPGFLTLLFHPSNCTMFSTGQFSKCGNTDCC